jgi:hypothetical protein
MRNFRVDGACCRDYFDRAGGWSFRSAARSSRYLSRNS